MVSPNVEQHSYVVQRNSQELAKSYPSWFRKVEWGAIICFFLLLGALFLKIILFFSSLKYLLLPTFFCGWIIADFFCGSVHWLADTWGSPDIPIVGPALIRPFREHHADQLAMTKHNFIETNGATSLLGIPSLILCLFIPIGPQNSFLSFVFFTLFFITLFGLLTNQIHKWAHTHDAPKFIRLLQDKHLILNPIHHQTHHTAPFNKYYCITSGWLNSFLTTINFFPYCEKLITKYTGALPRRDDIGEIAAKEILQKNENSFTAANNRKNI